MYLIIILYACFASVFTIGKAALETSEPLFFVGSRMILAGIVLATYVLFSKGTEAFKLNKNQWLSILALAAVNIYITNALEFWGLQYLSSTKTCFFYSLSPFIAAIGSYFFFNESLSTKKWMGLLIGFAGFTPVIFGAKDIQNELGSILIFSWPELAIFGAVIASASGWIILKQCTQGFQVNTFVANGLSMLIGGIFTTVNSYAVETWDPIPTSDLVSFLIFTVALMAISNFFCYNLYGYLLKKFSATFISFTGFVTPAFVALYGFFFLNEEVPLIFYPSYALVSFGIFLFYSEELKTTEVTISTPLEA